MLGELHDVMNELFRATVPQGVYSRLVTASVDVLDLRSVVFVLDDGFEPVATTLPSTGQRPETGRNTLPELTLDDASVVPETHRTGETQVLDLLGGDPALPNAEGCRVVSVPFHSHGVWTIAGDADAFDEETRDAIDMLASCASVALDRIEHAGTLVEQERETTRQSDRRSRVVNYLETVLRVGHITRQATDRAELETAVCDELLGLDGIEFVWFGHVSDGSLTPGTVAGDRTLLNAVDRSVDPDNDLPAATAVRTRQQVIVNDLADDVQRSPWRREALVHGYQAALSVPLQVRGECDDVLSVYTTEASGFDELEEQVFSAIAETVADAIESIQRRQALLADTAIELQFTLSGGNDLFTRVAAETGSQVEFQAFVPDDTRTVLFTTDSTSPEAVQSVLGASVTSTAHVPVDDEYLFEVTTNGTETPLMDRLIDADAAIQSLVAAGDDVQLTVSLPRDTDVSRFADSLRLVYEGVTLRSRVDVTRSVDTRESFLAELEEALTARQLEVVQTAYLAGFYEWPRENTGEEVAELLGITQPTFNRHLRTAERKLFAHLFNEE